MEKPERGEAEEGHRFRKAHHLGPPTGRRNSSTFLDKKVAKNLRDGFYTLYTFLLS